MKILLNIIAMLIVGTTIGQNVWVQKASLSVERYAAVGFSIGSKGYVGTGYNTLNQTQNDLWEWDQATDAWTQKASMSLPRFGAVSFVINGFAYVGLGLSSGVFRTDLQKYDPVLNSWTAMASLPAPGRYGSASFALNQKGYIVSGNLGTATGPYSNQLWEFDPVTNIWTSRSPLPATTRYSGRGVGIGNFAYIFGGLNGIGNSTSTFFNDLWQYDPSTDSWVQKTNYPALGRGYPTVFALNGKFVAGCGNHWSGSTNEYYSYDPVSDSWSNLPSIPSAQTRWASVGFEINGKGYNATGYLPNNTATNEFWELSESNPVIITNGTGGDLGCNPDPLDIESSLGNATVSGGCNSNITAVVVTDPPVNTFGCLWSTTRTFTATDACGISAAPVSVTVTYKIDMIPPIITPTNSNVDLGCNPSSAQIENSLGTATAVDNCDGSIGVNSTTDAPVSLGGCMWSATRTFTAVDGCGNSSSPVTVTVTYKVDNTPPVVTCNTNGNIVVCDGTSVILNPTAVDGCDGVLAVTCVRSDGLSINDPFDDGITTVTCSATDACGNTGSCSITVTVDCNDDDNYFCTYSQGGYGTPYGNHCSGTPSNSFLTSLLSTPLILGGGNNTLTITAADVTSGCFFTRLPSGGPSIKLTDSATCSNPAGIVLQGQKFKNTLLNQTITLGLNLRIPGSTLANLELAGQYLTTFNTSTTGCSSTNVAQIPGTNITYMLPANVINYLGGNNKVSDLYTLANQALAGTYSGTSPSLSQIAKAVDIINNAFLECRVLGSFSNVAPNSRYADLNNFESEDIAILFYPNPFSNTANINFRLNNYGSDVIIDIYNLSGQKIFSLFNSYVGPDELMDVSIDGSLLMPGIYIYYIKTANTVHHEKFTVIK